MVEEQRAPWPRDGAWESPLAGSSPHPRATVPGEGLAQGGKQSPHKILQRMNVKKDLTGRESDGEGKCGLVKAYETETGGEARVGKREGKQTKSKAITA